MRYTINLATRTFLDNRLINRICYVTIFILILLSASNIYRFLSEMREVNKLKSEIEAMQRSFEVKPVGISEADITLQKTQVRYYNEIIEKKSKSWTGILEKFEKATPAGVSISSLTPNSKDAEWKLEGYARTFKSVQQYLEKLEASKDFTDILLLSNRNMETSTKMKMVQFTISCKVSN